MSSEYFSDREAGARPAIEEDVKPSAWGGLVGLVNSLIERGCFGLDFPGICPDGAGVVGTNDRSFSLAIRAEIPDLEWPLRTETYDSIPFGTPSSEPYAPPTLMIMDLIEFCYSHVAHPISEDRHSFFGHHHLSFDREAGQQEFRSQVNRIFSRNGLAYELRNNGRIERLAPPVLQEMLQEAVFETGDSILDAMLNEARAKFLSPNPDTRRESLEKLWDAWERLKSIENKNKKLSTTLLLDKAAAEANLRAVLEEEARTLTRIGNDFQIRHSEVRTIPIQDDSHVDYLFHRLFALIQLLLGKR